MRGIQIIQHERDEHIAISLPHLLDNMREADRRNLVAYATEDEAFMTTILRAVATPEQSATIPNVEDVDTWFGAAIKTRLREKLIPMLDGIVAAELKQALEKAAKYEEAHRHLESLVHIEKLRMDAIATGQDANDRVWQWQTEWDRAKTLFPQYAADVAQVV